MLTASPCGQSLVLHGGQRCSLPPQIQSYSNVAPPLRLDSEALAADHKNFEKPLSLQAGACSTQVPSTGLSQIAPATVSQISHNEAVVISHGSHSRSPSPPIGMRIVKAPVAGLPSETLAAPRGGRLHPLSSPHGPCSPHATATGLHSGPSAASRRGRGHSQPPVTKPCMEKKHIATSENKQKVQIVTFESDQRKHVPSAGKTSEALAVPSVRKRSFSPPSAPQSRVYAVPKPKGRRSLPTARSPSGPAPAGMHTGRNFQQEKLARSLSPLHAPRTFSPSVVSLWCEGPPNEGKHSGGVSRRRNFWGSNLHPEIVHANSEQAFRRGRNSGIFSPERTCAAKILETPVQVNRRPPPTEAFRQKDAVGSLNAQPIPPEMPPQPVIPATSFELATTPRRLHTPRTSPRLSSHALKDALRDVIEIEQEAKHLSFTGREQMSRNLKTIARARSHSPLCSRVHMATKNDSSCKNVAFQSETVQQVERQSQEKSNGQSHGQLLKELFAVVSRLESWEPPASML